jgi:hypothetical protein
MNTIMNDNRYERIADGFYRLKKDSDFKRGELTIKDLRKDDGFVYITPSFTAPSIYYMEKSVASEILTEPFYRCACEILVPTRYHHNLTFDIDIKNKSLDDVRDVFTVIPALCDALHVDYMMYGYGEVSHKDINALIDREKIRYEIKTGFDKYLSLHIITKAVLTHEQTCELLSGSHVYLQHDNKKVEIDGSIYKNTHQILRLPVSNKWNTITNKFDEKGIKLNDKEYENIFVSTNDEVMSDENVEILKSFIYKEHVNVKHNDKKHRVIKQHDDVDDIDESADYYGKIGLLRNSGQYVIPVDEFKTLLFKNFTPHGAKDTFYTESSQLKAITKIIKNSPYSSVVLANVFHEWYNQIEHATQSTAFDYIIDNHELNINDNTYFYALLDNMHPSFHDYLMSLNNDEIDEDEIEKFNECRNKRNNQLSKKMRELKKKYQPYEDDYFVKYSKEINERKQLINEFNFRILAANNGVNQHDYKTIFYIDVIEGYKTVYINPEGIHSSSINLKNVEANFKNFNPEHLLKTSHNEILTQKYKYLIDRLTCEVPDRYMDKAQNFMKHFKTSFKYATDYDIYIDMFRHRLHNPDVKYHKNMACFNGSDSMKTAFPLLFEQFLHTSTLDINSESEFNEWKRIAKFLLIDEIPYNVKNSDKSRNLLKQLADYRGGLRIKNQPNDSEITHNFNILLNTNHDNFGGIFYGQTETEMFKRFHIIERQKFDISIDAMNKKLYRHDEKKHQQIVKAIVKYIMSLNPLTKAQLNECKKTQEPYIQKFKERTEQRACVPVDSLFSASIGIVTTDSKGSHNLRFRNLKKLLELNDFKTSEEIEKKYLTTNGLITIQSNRTIKINDITKLMNAYALIESDKDENDLTTEINTLMNGKL